MAAATVGSMKGNRALPLWLVLVLPGILLVVGVMVLPLVDMVVISFRHSSFGQILPGFTLANYIGLFTEPANLTLFANTFMSAAAVTVLCAVLGFPVAVVITNASPRWRGVLYFLVAAPLLVNTVVRTYGWLLILGRKGLINDILMASGFIDEPLALTGNYLGMIIGGTQVFLPFMILSLATSLMGIDRRLLEAGDILGATELRKFFTITLPLAMPGLIAGSVLVFSLMLGAFVTPLILGGTAIKYISVSVYTDALVLFNLPRATALSLILMVTVLVVYFIQKRLSGR
ncbi:MAG TPA: ABC transporter permease [Eoetvoesiella sp.]|uniref:ABC transporter permease n=1 Tax=Eoetvoesiella sp. TaxID=1966355 RepID=UPI002C3EFC7F|nr:ABC transporter permease [Eoetvoesiella sp.]HWK61446.1 ABC transporter permease [Eoetvoesiella sp.]